MHQRAGQQRYLKLKKKKKKKEHSKSVIPRSGSNATPGHPPYATHFIRSVVVLLFRLNERTHSPPGRPPSSLSLKRHDCPTKDEPHRKTLPPSLSLPLPGWGGMVFIIKEDCCYCWLMANKRKTERDLKNRTSRASRVSNEPRGTYTPQ